MPRKHNDNVNHHCRIVPSHHKTLAKAEVVVAEAGVVVDEAVTDPQWPVDEGMVVQSSAHPPGSPHMASASVVIRLTMDSTNASPWPWQSLKVVSNRGFSRTVPNGLNKRMEDRSTYANVKSTWIHPC